MKCRGYSVSVRTDAHWQALQAHISERNELSARELRIRELMAHMDANDGTLVERRRLAEQRVDNEA